MSAPLHIDDQLVALVRDLPLLARQVVDGYFHGLHRSVRRGSSPVFAAHRQYMAGDPARLVDWRVWARTDQLYIREYEQETNLRGYLFLDTSRSMNYGDGGENKMTYARILTAVLSLLLWDQNDAPGVGYLGQSTGIGRDLFVPPSNRGDHLNTLFHSLSEIEANGDANDLGTYVDLLSAGRGRALSVVISDGYFPEQQGREFLTELRERGHEVLFFHLLHPDEMEPSFEDDMLFVDSETGEEMELDGWAMRQGYQKKLSAFLRSVENLCFEQETPYCRILTNEPLDTALSTFLIHRAAMNASGR